MKFTVKIRDPRGKEKTEENHAQSEAKMRELYNMMGYELLEVLKVEKETAMIGDLDPATIAALTNSGGGVPNLGASNIKLPPPAPPQPKYKEYEDSGVKYRVELNSGTLQKQDWVKIPTEDLKNYAIQENKTEIINAHNIKLKLYKLEWVDL